MGFRPKKVRLKNGVLSLGMKKDDSRKEVLPFSSKKKPSREGTVKRCKTLHCPEKRFANVCSYLSFDLNRFRIFVGAKFLAPDLLMQVPGQFLRRLQPPFLSLMKEKEQKKIKASGTPAKFSTHSSPVLFLLFFFDG